MKVCPLSSLDLSASIVKDMMQRFRCRTDNDFGETGVKVVEKRAWERKDPSIHCRSEGQRTEAGDCIRRLQYKNMQRDTRLFI